MKMLILAFVKMVNGNSAKFQTSHKTLRFFPVFTCCEAAEGCDAGPLGVVAGEVLRVVLAAGLVHRHRVRTHGDHRALTWHTGTVSSGAKENRDSNEGPSKGS